MRKTTAPFIIPYLVVVYIMLYEWGLFEASVLRTFVNGLKIIIPVILLLLIPVKRLQSRSLRLFVLFYLLFMIWGVVPGIVSGEFQDSAITWLKYAPRLLFTFLMAICFLGDSQVALKTVKLLVGVAVFTVIQYLILVPAILFDLVDGVTIEGVRGLYYGPYGILGNQIAYMLFSELSFPVFRLTGFWLEPSMASGFLFASFFLARAIHTQEKTMFWRVASYLCLGGGFLTLSNAGYLAIAVPVLFSALFMKKSRGKFAYVVLLMILSVGLAFFALRGRALVGESGSAELRALSGARAGSEQDIYGGRVELLQRNIQTVLAQPFGLGMKIAGEGFYDDASGSAPILWLAYTGFIGLFLLLLREYRVAQVAMKYSKDSALIMSVSQAWLAVFTQHLAYGTWMSPLYLVLAIFVISTAYHQRHVLAPEHVVTPQEKLRAIRAAAGVKSPGIMGPQPTASFRSVDG